MPSYIPAKKNTAYVTYVALIDQASGKLFKANPTLAAGDVKVSIDGGALADLATLPTVTPAAGKQVKVSLSAGEMNGDLIGVLFSDAAGAEWNDLYLKIETSARQLDDLAFPTVPGRSMDTATTGEVGLDFDNVKDATGAHTLTNITVPVVTAVTNDVGITQAGADKAWSTAARTLTAFGFSVAISAAAVQAIWDALTSALTTGGSIGKKLADWALGSDSRVLVSADDHTSGIRVARVSGNVDGSIIGSVGSVASSVTIGPSSVAAIWDKPVAQIVTAATIGKLLVDDIDATVSSRAPESGGNVAAIKAKTDNLPAAPAAVGDIPTATQNADTLLNRDMAAVSDTTARSPLNALRFLRNRKLTAAGVLTVKKENDAADAWTAALTTDAAALPVIEVDPA